MNQSTGKTLGKGPTKTWVPGPWGGASLKAASALGRLRPVEVPVTELRKRFEALSESGPKNDPF